MATDIGHLEKIHYAMQRARIQEDAYLDQGLVTLQVLTQVAPMIGILGTLFQMISAFNASCFGPPPGLILHQAMIPLGVGVAIGALCYLGHRFLSRLAQDLQVSGERTAHELVHLLAEIDGTNPEDLPKPLPFLKLNPKRQLLPPKRNQIMRLQLCHIGVLLLPFAISLMWVRPFTWDPPSLATPSFSADVLSSIPALHRRASVWIHENGRLQVSLGDGDVTLHTLESFAMITQPEDTVEPDSWLIYAEPQTSYSLVEDVLESLRHTPTQRVYFMGELRRD